MVSTYVSYDLVTRDMSKSLQRVSQEPQVSKDAAYYKANIGNVKTVDDLLKDDRLYDYTMTANGLSDMIYAKGFMKKVLESDLTDQNSFANKLTDDRYREYAASFNFSKETTDIQTSNQEDDLIGLYKQSLTNQQDDAATETSYFDTAIDQVKSVDDLLNNSRLTEYVLKANGLDTQYYSTDFLKKVLTSDPNDSTSYVNTLTTNKQTYLNMIAALGFNTDGSLKNSTAMTASAKEDMELSYLETVPSTEGDYQAGRETDYYKEKLATVTKASDITGDSRLFSYVKTALGLNPNMLKSTFENIVTSDLSDPKSYANTESTDGSYAKIAKMFNFDTNGDVAAGNAQNSDQLSTLTAQYMTNYSAADDKTTQSNIDFYSTQMKSIDTVDKLMGNERVYNMVMQAFDIDQTQYSKATIKKVLTSDVNDPKSYVNMTHNKALISLASAFNFKSDGTAGVPLLAQSESTITNTAKDYIVQKTRFLTGKDQTTAKAAAEKDAQYYQDNIVKVRTSADLIKDRKLVDFVLTSDGLDPSKVSNDMLKQLFSSDLSDPKSFANSQDDERYAEFVASFNFNTDGKLDKSTVMGAQNRGTMVNTENLYLHQTLETEQGDSNAGVRLALYFQRKAPTITSSYDILGDSALLEVYRTAFSLPSDMSSMDIDQQAKVIDKQMDLKDLNDPTKLDKFLKRFTAMYDIANNTGVSSSASAALAILGGGTTSASISADLLTSVNALNHS
ncbi:DUF1217 domain-containing protein [Allorhizobium sp. BGMRC 0089]|uniref:DUF1217 domain-containing protein n=1 Tax=Allorhizobium sonneratiae TaxID=2934936 RepID=UPI0020340161|nr:DUF1217 domain-containing protein [Allorhizobium sonneratiae]MCM2294552.1 DUF1217 domain-containing protein [Allorhizobium sonneratiae]